MMRELNLEVLRRHSALGRAVADLRLVQVLEGCGATGRVLEVRTPSGLAFDVALDRGGDILRLSWKGVELGWHSATSARTPWPHADSEEGLGFLRGFDGFLVTCGLDHHGVPQTSSADAFKYPLRKHAYHPLHGRIYAQPAELIRRQIDWDASKIVIELTTRQASVFGDVLQLNRTIRADLDNASLSLDDRVTNQSFRPARHGILYHFNLGYPMLGKSARLEANGWPLASILGDKGAVPSDDHVEVVDVEHSPQDGHVGVSNADLGLAISLAFDPKMLPKTATWQAFQSGVFALGIEPQTVFDGSDKETLEAGETRSYTLKWDFLEI